MEVITKNRSMWSSTKHQKNTTHTRKKLNKSGTGTQKIPLLNRQGTKIFTRKLAYIERLNKFSALIFESLRIKHINKYYNT
jgi:hypothetical protein